QADLRQVEQAVEAGAVEGRLFRAPQHFDIAVLVRRDHVDVGPGVAVFLVAEVEDFVRADDADTDGGDHRDERQPMDGALLDQPMAGFRQRDIGSGDGGAARAAVRLQHVAVYPDGALAENGQFGDGAQAASDEALNLHRAPAGAALGLAGRAGMRGARQHPVLRRHPALILALQKRRHFVLDRSRADDARVAHLDQTGAFRIGHEAARQLRRAHLIAAASVYSWHNVPSSPLSLRSVGAAFAPRLTVALRLRTRQFSPGTGAIPARPSRPGVGP